MTSLSDTLSLENLPNAIGFKDRAWAEKLGAQLDVVYTKNEDGSLFVSEAGELSAQVVLTGLQHGAAVAVHPEEDTQEKGSVGSTAENDVETAPSGEATTAPEAPKEYTGEMANYQIISDEVPFYDQFGHKIGELQAGSIFNVPVEVGDKWVANGHAEKVA